MLKRLLLVGVLLSAIQARAYSHNPFNPMEWPYFPAEFDLQLYTLAALDCEILRHPSDCDREWSYPFPTRAEMDSALNVARTELALEPARTKKHFELAIKRNQVFLSLLRETKADLIRLLGRGNVYDADLTRMLARQGELLSRALFDEYRDTKDAQADLVKYADVVSRMFPAIEQAKSVGERHRAQIALAQSWQAIKKARLAELEARTTFSEYMSRVAWVAGNRFGIVNYYMKEGARRYWFYEFPWIEMLVLKADSSCPANMVDFVRENMQGRLGIYFQQDLTGEIDSIPESGNYRSMTENVVNLANSDQRRKLVRILKKKEFRIACVETKNQKDPMTLNIKSGVWRIPFHREKESVIQPGAELSSAEFAVPKYHLHSWGKVFKNAK